MDRSLVKEILQSIITDGNIKVTSKGFQFRCIKCGDSKKSKSKKRGWILFKGDMITYFCHNCNCKPQSFKNFVREYNTELYNEHFKNVDVRERLKRKRNYNVVATLVSTSKKRSEELNDLSKEIVPHTFPLTQKNITGIYKKELQKIAVRFVKERKIPKKFYKDFLVCYEEPSKEMKNFRNRLIIPYYDKNGNVYCFSGRTLHDEVPKYLTWNHDNIKIFNFYNVDPKLPVPVFEGAIDSMFIKNSVALTGITTPESEQFYLVKKTFPNRVWVTDNQWCDKTGDKVSMKLAEAGERMLIYPPEWKEWKDMNQIILGANLTSEAAYSIILNNVYKGKDAILKLKTMRGKKYG